MLSDYFIINENLSKNSFDNSVHKIWCFATNNIARCTCPHDLIPKKKMYNLHSLEMLEPV